MIDNIRSTLRDARDALDRLICNDRQLQNIVEAAAILSQSLLNKGRVFACGNGGVGADRKLTHL